MLDHVDPTFRPSAAPGAGPRCIVDECDHPAAQGDECCLCCAAMRSAVYKDWQRFKATGIRPSYVKEPAGD